MGGTCRPNGGEKEMRIGGKEPLGRQRRRWVDNIKMDVLEIGWGGVDWIGLAQDRHRNEPSCWEHNWWPLSSIQLVS
jgi:hypothetical protein